MYYENISIFIDDKHKIEGLKYPIGFVCSGDVKSLHVTAITDSEKDLSNPHKLLKEIENDLGLNLKQVMFVENKNIEVVDVVEIKENVLLFVILKINGLEFAYEINVDYLDSIFGKFETMEDVTKQRYLFYTDSYYHTKPHILEDSMDNPIRKAIATSTYEKIEPNLNTLYDIGSIYLNEFGEKAVFLGEYFTPSDIEYVLDFESESQLSYVGQYIWLPITDKFNDNLIDIKEIELKTFKNQNDFLDYYIKNIKNYFLRDVEILTTLSTENYMNTIKLMLIENMFKLSGFNGVVHQKKLYSDSPEANLNTYLEESIFYNMIGKLDRQLESINSDFMKTLPEKVSILKSYSLYDSIKFSVFATIFSQYVKLKYTFKNESDIWKNNTISYQEVLLYLAEILTKYNKKKKEGEFVE